MIRWRCSTSGTEQDGEQSGCANCISKSRSQLFKASSRDASFPQLTYTAMWRLSYNWLQEEGKVRAWCANEPFGMWVEIENGQ